MQPLIYPGFTLEQFFNTAPIPIQGCQSNTEYYKYSGGTVEFKFNSHGYRTNEIDPSVKDYILIAGCSLTEGHGLHLDQTWGKKLEQQLGVSVVNLAKGAANAEFVSQNLINWIRGDFTKPIAVIAQWPHPYRLTHWNNNRAQFILNQNADDLFRLKVKHGNEYFYSVWIKSIMNLDIACRSKNIPLLHLCFEEPSGIGPAANILSGHNIQLHLDYKTPNSTWHFDSAALDQIHHSNWCTTQWSQRVLTLLNSMLQ